MEYTSPVSGKTYYNDEIITMILRVEKQRKQANDNWKKKYQADPSFREKNRIKANIHYHENPEYYKKYYEKKKLLKIQKEEQSLSQSS